MKLTDELRRILVTPMDEMTVEELRMELEWQRQFTGMSSVKRLEEELRRRGETA